MYLGFSLYNITWEQYGAKINMGLRGDSGIELALSMTNAGLSNNTTLENIVAQIKCRRML